MLKSPASTLTRGDLCDGIATLSLDNYARRNALSGALVSELLAWLDVFRAEQARVVILRTLRPEKVWSAGHDIHELPKFGQDPLPYGDPLEQLLRAIKGFPAPVIAMVQGSVWGGATDLVLACDIVLGDETCQFAITPAKLGLPYNAVGFMNFISRLPLNIVKEMFFTAEPISARRAEGVGLLNALVPADQLEAHTSELARVIASRSPDAIQACKEALRELSEAAALSPGTYERLHALRRDVYFGANYREGIQAFLDKRAPRFNGPEKVEAGRVSG